jgi:carbonic anhydrase
MIETSNELLEAHECEALVITCMDFRFIAATYRFVHDELAIPTFDFVTVPGAAKGVAEKNQYGQYEFDVTALSQKLHKIGKVIIVNHATCGAYGIENPEQERERQTSDLKNAKALFEKTFPGVSVRAFFAQKGNGGITYLPVQ